MLFENYVRLNDPSNDTMEVHRFTWLNIAEFCNTWKIYLFHPLLAVLWAKPTKSMWIWKFLINIDHKKKGILFGKLLISFDPNLRIKEKYHALVKISINGIFNEKCYGNKRRKIARLYFLEFIFPDEKFDWGVRNHVFKDRDILRCVRNHMMDMRLTNQSIALYLKSIVTFLNVIMR